MPESTVTTCENLCDTTKVTTDTVGDCTTTTTDNCVRNIVETTTFSDPVNAVCGRKCPCGFFDLDKLAAESRRCAFKSSNIVAATSNSIVIFTMLVLQEIIKDLCREKMLDLDTLFLITTALNLLGDGIQINNPQPFNS